MPLTMLREGQCLDISSYGLGLTTDCVLNKGEIVRISMPLKNTDNTLPVYAEVMWAKADSGHYRAGARFLI